MVFLRVQSGQCGKFIVYFQLQAMLRNVGTVQLFPPQSFFMVWPGTNFFFHIYINIHFIYRSTWYGCKLRLDYKLPAAHAFHRIAYTLSPTSLFRTLKILTDYSTHLLKLKDLCGTLVHRPQISAHTEVLILSVYCLDDKIF